MKIKILTIHSIPNFGSVFQTYALSKFLKSQGNNDVEIIDYRPSYFDPHSIRSLVAMFLNLKKYVTRKLKFNRFLTNNVKLTPCRYRTLKDLQSANFSADLLIAGGDQLWNVYHDCGRDDAYKLTFSNIRKISYGTSMGQNGFTDNELAELASKIKDFKSISVRESSSVTQLKKVGLNAVWSVDPVYLLSSYDYADFIKPVPHENYLLVYLVTPSPLLDRTIDFLSKKYGLKVILCSGFSKKCKCDLFLSDLGPEEVLSYIKHANIILSASFHATSFSLIFEKQFFTILPNPKTNERIVDLLNTRQLSRRIITEESALETALTDKIDYSKIASYDALINNSKQYLRTAINEISE